jgi:hypothetical protein
VQPVVGHGTGRNFIDHATAHHGSRLLCRHSAASFDLSACSIGQPS